MKDNNQTLEKIVKDMAKEKIESFADLDSFKRKTAKKFEISIPSNIELLKAYHNLVKIKRLRQNENLEYILRKRRIRSLSGIVNVSVLTKPFPCPGRCLYCPEQKGIPKSYVSGEPAVERAAKLKFDPYLQVKKRIEALERAGHPTDKIELRIVGGTWSFYKKQYQTWFIKKCFQAANDLSSLKKADKKKRQRKTLEEEQKINEKAKHKIIGLSIETRPDFIDKKEIRRLRKLGVTMVELGVQSIYDDVLKINKRGHKIKATIQATKMLKEAGFKVLYQIMPNLLGSNFQRDIEMFKEIFSNPNFQPDYLKIYPLALMKNSPLYKEYKKGKYKPYSKNKLIELLIEIKKKIPYYCRIQRIIRDIPSEMIIEGGAKISNLREIVQREMAKQGYYCHCIRCREVRESYNKKEKIYLFRENYFASEGKEIFLSYENKERTKLYSLIRLRLPSFLFNKKEKPIFSSLKNSALIREIHTYGQLSPLSNSRKIKSPQHKGLGKKLMKKAEEIIQKESSADKVAVISGVGVRGYYRKLGYRLKETYLIKKLR